jgi:hypothetical protein
VYVRERCWIFLEDFFDFPKLVPQARPGAAGERGVGQNRGSPAFIWDRNPRLGPALSANSYLEMGDVCLGRRVLTRRSQSVVGSCSQSRFALGLFAWFETSFDPFQVPIECDHSDLKKRMSLSRRSRLVSITLGLLTVISGYLSFASLEEAAGQCLECPLEPCIRARR